MLTRDLFAVANLLVVTLISRTCDAVDHRCNCT